MSERQQVTQQWLVKVAGGDQVSVRPGDGVEIGRKPLRPLADDGVRRMEFADPTKSVSKRHALFTVTANGTATIRDLHSTNGSYVVRDDGALMRIPPDVDFELPSTAMRIQLGDVPIDFLRVEAPRPAYEVPSVPDLFDYALSDVKPEPDIADMSVDDILDLRAGEPTSMFNADTVVKRAGQLRAAEQTSFRPAAFNPASGGSPSDGVPSAGMAAFASASSVASPLATMPASVSSDASGVARTSDGHDQDTVSVPINVLPTGDPKPRNLFVDALASRQTTGQDASQQPSAPDSMGSSDLIGSPQSEYPVSNAGAPIGAVSPSDAPLGNPNHGIQATQPSPIGAVVPISALAGPHRHIAQQPAATPALPSAEQPQPVAAHQPQPTAVVESAAIDGAALAENKSNGAAPTDEASIDTASNDNAPTAAAPNATAPNEAVPTDTGAAAAASASNEIPQEHLRYARPAGAASDADADAADDEDNESDQTGVYTPAFEPGSIFDRISKGQFKRPEPTIEVDGMTSDEAKRTEDYKLQCDMARHPELLPFIAMNPSLYDELYEWLAALGNADIDKALESNAGYQDYRKAVGK
ncbi:FHA domain-containing protein [Bifidobacterium jacchi]|uniref:variant leucine-rich repeat-containing protein n=1 Tax=Bifidobacterium jacchi TaxID=2490545 RepID=UPI001F4FC775|nr:FHA domain-containing protein [Bifidobacterium jacchi]